MCVSLLACNDGADDRESQDNDAALGSHDSGTRREYDAAVAHHDAAVLHHDAAPAVADASGPSFSAYLEGDAIMLGPSPDASHRECLYFAVQVEKRDGTAWVPMTDERPRGSGQHPGFYFDGIYTPPALWYICDGPPGCGGFPEATTVGHAEEYVKTGTKAPPMVAQSGPALVDVFEARPFHGDVRVVVNYSPTSRCDATLQAFVPLTIPEDGVCCPLTVSGCSREGLPGGWAPSKDTCPAMPRPPDSFYPQRHTIDSHGCPTACCGCDDEQDAGK
jgi:hypothetical protein